MTDLPMPSQTRSALRVLGVGGSATCKEIRRSHVQTGCHCRTCGSPATRSRSMRPSLRTVGVALAAVLLATLAQIGPAGAEPANPQRPATEPRPVEAGLFQTARPELLRQTDVRALELGTATPASAGPGAPAAPDQRVGRGERAAATALQYVGAPYRWGGSSPVGFDCSGFVLFIYGKVGISLPHDVLGQLAAGRRVAIDALLPGDVLVFENTYRPGPSHSGIYLGEGRFVHAANERLGVTVNSLRDGNWATHLYGASRLDL
jgi:cell wall-associated NlpC family hydrolase